MFKLRRGSPNWAPPLKGRPLTELLAEFGDELDQSQLIQLAIRLGEWAVTAQGVRVEVRSSGSGQPELWLRRYAWDQPHCVCGRPE